MAELSFKSSPHRSRPGGLRSLMRVTLRLVVAGAVVAAVLIGVETGA